MDAAAGTGAGPGPAGARADSLDPAGRQAALQRLLATVSAEPWAHDFFALLRRVDALRPEAPATGHALLPRAEALRLGQPPELDFAPAALSALDLQRAAAPHLSVRFFGLLGPQGPMPLHFTEFVRERRHQHGDTSAAHFLDMFHHRLLSLFYRAWAQAQPVVHADRPQDDRFLAWLLAVAGQQPGAGVLPARALAFHAGWLAGRTRHAEGLCKVLRQEFDMPVAVVPHGGHWLQIEPEDRSRLGFAGNRPERARQAAARLGHQANAGSKVWDRQYRFGLQMGPMGLAAYRRLLPGGPDWPALNAWVRQLAPASLHWSLTLVLHPAEQPAPRLGRGALGVRHGGQIGGQGAAQIGTQLGISTWLGRRPGTRHRHAQRLTLRPGLSFLQRHTGT